MATKRATKTPAKKAAKKAAKKTSRKRSATAAPTAPAEFNDLIFSPRDVSIFDMDDTEATAIEAALESLENRSKGALKFMDAAQLRRAIIPVPSLAFQYMIGARGIRRSTITEFLADEGVGKTTLLFLLAGWFAQQGCIGQYIDCESKPQDPNRMLQSLSRDRKMASTILKKNLLKFSDAPTVAQITQLMPAWAKDMRVAADKIPFTAGRPIITYMDLWTSALTAAEAGGGWLPEGTKSATAATKAPKAKKAAKKMKKVGEGSKPDHAVASHEFFRRLKPLLNTLNWNVFITAQRNDRVEMSGGGSYAKPAARTNDTARGGRAIKQHASLRITLNKMGKWESRSDGQPDHGHKLEMHVLKNSYGWPSRSCIVRVRTDQVGATETRHAETFSFAEADCDLCVSQGIFGMKLDKGLYSSDELNAYNLSAEDMYELIHSNAALVERAGEQLGIPGYGNIGQYKPDEKVDAPAEDADDVDDTEEDELDDADAADGEPSGEGEPADED